MLWLLLFVSFTSTSYGVLSYVTDVSSLASIDFGNVKVIVSLAVVFVITLFAFLSLDNFLNSRSIKGKFFFLLLYIFITSISIGFGYPFWWNNLIANNALNNKIALVTDNGLNNTKQIQNNLNLSKQYTQKISDMAKNKQAVEETRGSSCDAAKSPPGPGPYNNSRITITAKVDELVKNLNAVNAIIDALLKELTTITNRTRKITINSNDSTKIEKAVNEYVKEYNRKVDAANRDLVIKVQDISKLINTLKSATTSKKNNKPIIMEEVPQNKNFVFEKGFTQCADKDIYHTLLTIEKNFNTIHNLQKSKLHMNIADKVNRARKALNGLLSEIPFIEFKTNDKYDFSFIALLFTILIDFGILALTILVNNIKKYKKIVEIVDAWCKNKKDKETIVRILNDFIVDEKYIILPKEKGIDYIELTSGDEKILTHNDFKEKLNIISSINNAISLNPITKLPAGMDFTHINSMCFFDKDVTYVGYKINDIKTIEEIRRQLAICQPYSKHEARDSD